MASNVKMTPKRIFILITFLIATLMLVTACTAQHTLSTSVSPSGSGLVTPSNGTYDDGTEVTLNATPATGWFFSEWSGDATGSLSPVTITMDGNKSVTAQFKAPPIAEISADSTTVRVGDEVSLSANYSTDPDSNIVSYEWDFGDGNTASGRTVNHKYSKWGTYTAKLTVKDSDGLSDTTEMKISAIPWGVIKIEVRSSSWWPNIPYLNSGVIAGMLESHGFAVYDGSSDYDATLDINYEENMGHLYETPGQNSVAGHGTVISCWISLYDKAGALLYEKVISASTSPNVPYTISLSVNECLRVDAQKNFEDKFSDSFDEIIEIARQKL